MISNPAPPHETCQRTMPFYLQATGMTLRLPYILNWSCSELGLSLHPLDITLWLFLLMCANNPICDNKAIYKGVSSHVDSSLLLLKYFPVITSKYFFKPTVCIFLVD